MAINQAGSLSIGPNNINVSRSGRENAFAVDSIIENEGIEKSNRDAKVDLKVQPNTTTTTLVFYCLTTTMGMLMSTFFVFVSVYYPLAPIYDSRLPFF